MPIDDIIAIKWANIVCSVPKLHKQFSGYKLCVTVKFRYYNLWIRAFSFSDFNADEVIFRFIVNLKCITYLSFV